ncbi:MULTISPECIES: 50S ribosomal protein L15 [Treponema]|uniref:Large ribosomal subunit protein uL15 n=1 Tax=Treponema denticola (strain ATCC 35405 / DSM 14222 / CIP 103919 / JCM 8153 / KCTC 15104) TaxID=243275 RepID=RL15_TREDE|nr:MULTISPECIES: 50S ribosomal protein L15 [Treponema]Q73PL3.1 RecName: Full=Large ribosomal subunit protein uL15; AltName: Full=50S ribosomal protein L15 [Treponema denticola ATCC 35405]AAS11277.1 ribosomal protein L15 [Treponema denticola ATCC 35405]EMB34350.1 50S ribosomal protein L15 [Treponema denticola ATCC 35404]EMB36796.1 50S ribosomal protein L15 [Treponema denticola ATCC 33521]HCY95151.1 50S ribosomal protein L15 [Treponema sp.]
MFEFNLTVPAGATHKKKIVGRGSSSGWGKTSGKGHKGQQARSGGKVYAGFEGGQMPLYRRVAKKGFSNYPFKKEFYVVNLAMLETKYSDGETVNKESLMQKGLLRKGSLYVKVLGTGDITKKLTVDVDRISASAKEKIEKAGGTIVQSEA